MARTLDAILAELEPGYSGSRKNIQTQMGGLAAQEEAGISGLKAQLDTANQNILSGARSRGIGFSGIPIAEQTRYAADNFAPAVANLKSTMQNRRLTLDEALNGLNREQRTNALSLRQQELDREEQQRQWEQNLAWEREKAAAARAAEASSSAGIGAYLQALNGGGQQTQAEPQLAGGRTRQQAVNAVGNLLKMDDPTVLRSIIAINESARRGNTYDQAKLELIRSAKPGLFVKNAPNYDRIGKLLNMYNPGSAQTGDRISA